MAIFRRASQQLSDLWMKARNWAYENALFFLLLLAAAVGFVVIVAETARYGAMGFSNKTFWDWLDLLIVPAVLAIAAFLLNRSERKAEREIAVRNRVEDRRTAQERSDTERQIALDRQRQNALENYLDGMKGLLLDEGLRSSPVGAEVRTVARARTLAVLRSLDATRIEQLVRFLREAGLLEIIRFDSALFQGVDLSRVNLMGLNLRKANLAGADLRSATLSMANLEWADLSEANLEKALLNQTALGGALLRRAQLLRAELQGADLEEADLSEADLSYATLRGARLRQAELSGANLYEAYLADADLRAATLDQASLQRTHLWGSDLTAASLVGASLVGANLTQANLMWANLSEADLTEASLVGAKYNAHTRWPYDFDIESEGVVLH